MGEKKALTNEAILAIEKKMNMSLDDLIKDSKKQTKNSSAEKKKINTRRVSNKTLKPFHNPGSATARDKSSKLQRFTDTMSSHRQAALALRRSNFQQSHKFSVAIVTGKRPNISPDPSYRQKPFNGKRIENLNTRKNRYPPVQTEAIVYVTAKKWNDQGRMMVPMQKHVASQKWNNQARILVPKHKNVEATGKKSVWQRLSVVPSRSQF